jgi:hypothetical protein
MDSLVSLVDQVIPGSPLLAIITAVLLLAAVVKLERARRRQVEQCLREDGIPLPYWPDDPPELYLAGPRSRRDVDDQDDRDGEPETAFARTIPPLPDMGQHHRRSSA